MTFAASRPISADKLSIRYVDAFADLPAAGSVLLGTQVFVVADNTYYIAQPSATAPHAASWRAAGSTIGVNGKVATLLGGISVPVRVENNPVNVTVTDDDYIIEYRQGALGAPVTVNMPSPAAAIGRTLIIKSAGAANGAGPINLSATVDNAAASIATPYGSLRVYSDGIEWLSC